MILFSPLFSSAPSCVLLAVSSSNSPAFCTGPRVMDAVSVELEPLFFCFFPGTSVILLPSYCCSLLLNFFSQGNRLTLDWSFSFFSTDFSSLFCDLENRLDFLLSSFFCNNWFWLDCSVAGTFWRLTSTLGLIFAFSSKPFLSFLFPFQILEPNKADSLCTEPFDGLLSWTTWSQSSLLAFSEDSGAKSVGFSTAAGPLNSFSRSDFWSVSTTWSMIMLLSSSKLFLSSVSAPSWSDCCDNWRWNSSLTRCSMSCDTLRFLANTGCISCSVEDKSSWESLLLITESVSAWSVISCTFGASLDLRSKSFKPESSSSLTESDSFSSGSILISDTEAFLISLCIRCSMPWETFGLCWK